MDLKRYYKTVREIEDGITDAFVIVVGLSTQDGGKEGTQSEVTKAVAAKIIADGRVRLASEDEATTFYGAQAEARRQAEAATAAQRMQVTLVPTADLYGKSGKGSRE